MAQPKLDVCDVDEAEETVCSIVAEGREPEAVLHLIDAALTRVAQGVDDPADAVACLRFKRMLIIGRASGLSISSRNYRSHSLLRRPERRAAAGRRLFPNRCQYNRNPARTDAEMTPGRKPRPSHGPRPLSAPSFSLPHNAGLGSLCCRPSEACPAQPRRRSARPRRPFARNPENAIQNKAMIGWHAPIRTPDRADEAIDGSRILMIDHRIPLLAGTVRSRPSKAVV